MADSAHFHKLVPIAERLGRRCILLQATHLVVVRTCGRLGHCCRSPDCPSPCRPRLASPRLASPGLAAWPSAQQVPRSLRGSHCELRPCMLCRQCPWRAPIEGTLFRCTLWQRKDPDATASDEVEFVMAEGSQTQTLLRPRRCRERLCCARAAGHAPASSRLPIAAPTYPGPSFIWPSRRPFVRSPYFLPGASSEGCVRHPREREGRDRPVLSRAKHSQAKQ